jgi:hypothetical protein
VRCHGASCTGSTERRLEGQAVAAEELQRERRLGDLRDHRLDLRRQLIGHSPLDVAQVAAAVQDDGVAEPRLLHHPLQSGQAVLALPPHRVELPARTERAAGALQQHLVAPLGQGQCNPYSDQASAAVRAAHQRGRQPVTVGARRPPIGQQFDTVGHGDAQVLLDDDVPGLRRVQLHEPLQKMAGELRRHDPIEAGALMDGREFTP